MENTQFESNDSPLTKATKENSPVIRICSYCAKEFPNVDLAIRQRSKVGDLRFSHGVCLDHTYEMYKASGFPEDKIKASLAKFNPKDAPIDLRKNVQLRQEMESGVFTKQDLEKRQQAQQTATSKLNERLKTLAGIIP